MTLQKISELVSRGAAALEPQEKSILTVEFNRTINDFTFSNEAVKKLALILSELYSSNLTGEIASSLDENVYYSFGLNLLEARKGNVEINQLIWGYLDLLRNPNFLRKIYERRDYEELIYRLLKVSNFNIDRLFSQRNKDYSTKILLSEIRNGKLISYSWKTINERVKQIRSALAGLFKSLAIPEPQAAFILENDIKTILLDIACLTGGVKNVIIPAISVAENIFYILRQTETPVVFVSGEKQLVKLSTVLDKLPKVKKIILLKGNSIRENVISFNEFLSFAGRADLENKLAIHEPATIMYTSGTTGNPKGIIFSNLNLMFKRFCRALALPDVGDSDKFLSYLPLFHTFGRYLEMLGAIFWGAEYVKMENPSLESLLQGMKKVKPTIFISIPKKWMQLYEHIQTLVNIELDELMEIEKTVREVTGGKLKWGLSAAGFLPPEIFLFFQSNGIELMSGFGMTEATGGITMTPPGRYKPNSLGKALPGIKIKLKDDGELLIKGGYVMLGYYGQSKSETFDKEDWLPTGDVMVMDDDGFVEIVDRKKEIYKNIKGETIAPQKIENFFKDFETVKQVFVVGDHKPFNTALIVPNYSSEYNLRKLTEKKLRDYFASVVVTVNKFIAPYERILDFRIVPRAFSREKGELTPKGTFKRKVIEQNFGDIINEMYLSNHYDIPLNNLIIRIPNWFLREKGILITDVKIENRKLKILGSSLPIEIKGDNAIRFGDYLYLLEDKVFDLHEVLTNPLLWLGNESLVEFTTEAIEGWARGRQTSSIKILKKYRNRTVQKMNSSDIEQYLAAKETSLKAFHLAFTLIEGGDVARATKAFELIKTAASDKSLANREASIFLLKNPQLIKNKKILKESFLLSVEIFEQGELLNLIPKYFRASSKLLSVDLSKNLAKNKVIRQKLNVFQKVLENFIADFKKHIVEKEIVFNLFDFLLEYSKAHPITYKEIRRTLVKYQLMKELPEISEYAGNIRIKCRSYFREWLGKNQKIAVDPETGDEYEWKDVIVISEEITDKVKRAIIKAFSVTPIIREAVFLFNRGRLIGLNDILPGGVWVSRLMELNGKGFYRIIVQTRKEGAFEISVIIDENTPEEKIKEEINWNILAADKKYLFGFVAEFGGYWNEFKMWSAEYLEEETVAQYLKRKNKLLDEKTSVRLFYLFPYFVWSASAAYFGFWKTAQKKILLKNASIKNFKIPHHDYQSGAKIISLSERQKFTSYFNLFNHFFEEFILKTFRKYPYLTRQSVWYYLFSGAIESLGINEGKALLQNLLKELKEQTLGDFWLTGMERLEQYLKKVDEQGFIPRRLFFAIKRFLRWRKLNEHADVKIQAEMIDELFETYNLEQTEKDFPAARLKFYLETVFYDSEDEIRKFLMDIVHSSLKERLEKTEIEQIIVRSGILEKCGEKEKYFLTRLAYPYIRANDYAEIINTNWKGAPQFNLVVRFTDKEGNKFFVRRPNSPKEISRLHGLFTAVNMFVNFRPNNEFLVALSERGFIIGGLFYNKEEANKIHMEKIVVSHPFRRKGVSEALMKELFNRAKNEGVKYITTGFFRPEYFYRFGFKIEPKYSGLVKKL